MSEKRVCLYHRSDLDGHCSGAIFAKAMELQRCPYRLIGIDYGDDIPWSEIDACHIVVIDWSFQPWTRFAEVVARCKSLTWIDHHKSAIETWEHHKNEVDTGKVSSFLRTDQAGCELAWSWFLGDWREPLAVHLLGRYDVWDHSDDRIMPFQLRMRMETTDPEQCRQKGSSLWDILLDEIRLEPELLHKFIEEGSLLVRYQAEQDAREVRSIAFDVQWNDMRWLACNRTGKGSKFFESKWDPKKYHGMMAFGWTGRHWRIGLYSDRDDVDCSIIAKTNGGGGHKGAAGFQCNKLPFVLQSEVSDE